MFNWGPHFFCPSQKRRLAGQAESCLKPRQAPLMLIHPEEVWPGSIPIEERLRQQRRGLSLDSWRKFPPGRIALRRVRASSCSRPPWSGVAAIASSKKPRAGGVGRSESGWDESSGLRPSRCGRGVIGEGPGPLQEISALIRESPPRDIKTSA